MGIKKEGIITYLFIVLLLGVAIGLLYFFNIKFTGFVTYGDREIVEKGQYWDKMENIDGSYNLIMYNSPVNYYTGSEYLPISYGSCGSNCFRDWNGFIYRVSSDTQKAYVNLYDADDNLLSRFGFGITGEVGGTNYRYTTLNFTWIWSQENIGEEYIFRAWNNKTNFNWTQEFHFYPNQSMKIKNTITNNLANINNAKFWYIQVVDEEDGIWFNGTKYTEDMYKTGEFDSLLSQIRFEDYYAFDYSDLLENGFNITDFYLGDGSLIGVGGIRILAIGVTKGNSVFPTGASVSLDPTVKLSGDGADAYVGAAGDANKNFGSDVLLKTGDVARTYINFNISSIPLNQNIDNATLCLYVLNTKKTQTINVSHVYESWDESTITWNNQPCGTNFNNSLACNLTAESFVQMNSGLSYTWLCWKITHMIEKDYNSGNKNISMIIYTSDSDKNDFYSKEYSNSSLRPYLNITYSPASPIIAIISPQESENFNYNTSLPLNFTIINSSELDSCWYNLNNGGNVTVLNCENTTFNTSDGEYELNFYVNDSFGDIGNDSVNFSVYATGVSVTILEPIGIKSSRTGISIQFNAFGNNLTCWYNVKTSIFGNIIENTTLENCLSSSFDVSTDGNYIFNLYANNSLGAFDSASSSFSVDTSTPVSPVSPPSNGGGGGGSIIIPGKTELSVSEIQNLITNPKDVEKISWIVKNTGTNFLNDCKFKSIGEFFSWIDYLETKNLAAGEEYEFIFDLNVPETITSGKYVLGVALECQGITESVNFTVEIIEKKLNFYLIKVERIAKEQIKIIYSLEELSGLEQEVELQFLLFGPNNEKAAEVKETKIVPANSKEEFEILIFIEPSLEGELDLLINLNSKTYSTFIQENIILGAPISGFAIFNELGKTDNLISLIFIVLFCVFAFFIVKRVIKHRKKKRKKK